MSCHIQKYEYSHFIYAFFCSKISIRPKDFCTFQIFLSQCGFEVFVVISKGFSKWAIVMLLLRKGVVVVAKWSKFLDLDGVKFGHDSKKFFHFNN